jgi:hypothetical protein
MAVIGLVGVSQLAAQNTKMPSTLRYGSGYFDVPSATVLPHLAITGTYSGFFVSLEEVPIVDQSGRLVGFDAATDKSQFYSDGSVAIGLFDRVELGATLQHFGDAEKGGTMVGGFGRLAILRPETEGIGLAVGARFVGEPSFDPSTESFQPPRLGFPDERFKENYTPEYADDVNTTFTPYVVGGVHLMGPDFGFLPDYDVSLTGGWSFGMTEDGGDQELDWYRTSQGNGWIVGGALHFMLSETVLLNVLADYNSFDVNAGASLDFGGIRVGAFVLGANYLERVTEYRSWKLGGLVSVALCPQTGGLCKPSLMDRPAPDTVQLPPPPPDTVVVEREVAPPMPTGTTSTICLATGQNQEIMITAQGDTLVGPNRVSVRDLGPSVGFAGAYAAGEEWFESDEDIQFERATYSKSGGEISLDCDNIMRVGEHMGIPLFADRSAEQPYSMLYVPVGPGVWQAYETGLRRTRG